jgi:hypothetical protein
MVVCELPESGPKSILYPIPLEALKRTGYFSTSKHYYGAPMSSPQFAVVCNKRQVRSRLAVSCPGARSSNPDPCRTDRQKDTLDVSQQGHLRLASATVPTLISRKDQPCWPCQTRAGCSAPAVMVVSPGHASLLQDSDECELPE